MLNELYGCVFELNAQGYIITPLSQFIGDSKVFQVVEVRYLKQVDQQTVIEFSDNVLITLENFIL